MSENSFQDPNANVVRYDVQINNQSVEAAISKMQAMADRLSQSVGGYSSNVLGNAVDSTARMANTGGPGAGLSPGLFTSSSIPQTMMAAQMAVQGGGAMSPQAAVARDAMMMQYNAMGPSSGFGPALTTPWGDPTVNMFRQQAQAHQFNAGFLPVFGPPGAPGDQMGGKGQGFMRGPGGAPDMAGLMIHRAMGWGIANDNLEDPMIRNIERRTEAFGEKVASAGRYAMTNMVGSTLGSTIGGAAGSVFGGPLGTVVGGILGGFVGDKMGGSIDATVGRLARPFTEAGADFRQYTAPYIQGDRVGGGMSYKQSMDTQRDLAKRMTSDSWFTASEYSDLIKIGGETGVFKMTGNKDQALKAVDNLGETVKALYALGVKSRDMMKQVDQSLGTFGLDVRNPQAMASFYGTLASTAQSAGKTTAQMADAVAPAAQLFGSQGLGFKTGAELAAQHLAAGGALGRSGKFGAIENTYFGGPDGFASALTQGTAAAFRTPIGEAAVMSMFGGDMGNLRKTLSGGGLSVTDIVNGAGTIASDDPERYLGLRARMPFLMNKLPGEALDRMMINMTTGTYQDTHGSGKIDAEKYMTHLMTAYGQDATSANARITQIGGFQDIARDLRKSSRDQMEMQRMEGLRAPGFRRRFEKTIEGTLGLAAKDFSMGMSEWGHEISKNIEESFTGVHRFDMGADGAKLENISTVANEMSRSRRELAKAGLTPLPASLSSVEGDPYNQAVLENAGRLLGGSSQVTAKVQEALGANGQTYSKIATGGFNTLRREDVADEIAGLLSAIGATEQQVAQDPKLRDRLYQEADKAGVPRAKVDIYLGMDAKGNVTKTAYQAKQGGGVMSESEIQAANKVVDAKGLTPLAEFQSKYSSLVGGMAKFESQSGFLAKGAFRAESEYMADRFIGTKAGDELVGGLSSDYEASLKHAAKTVFGVDDPSKLTDGQQETLGGVLKGLSKRGDEKTKAKLKDFMTAGDGGADAESRSYEILQERFKKGLEGTRTNHDIYSGRTGAMYEALNGSAGEVEAAAPAVQRTLISELMKQSSSKEEFESRLAEAGIKREDYAAYGLTDDIMAKMGSDPKGASALYGTATDGMVNGLPESIKSKINVSGIRDQVYHEGAGAIAGFIKSTNQAVAAKRGLAKVSPDLETRDLAGLQVALGGKDKIGNFTFAQFKDKFNSGDTKDFDEVLSALGGDAEAAEGLGFDKQKLKSFGDLNAAIADGSVNKDTIMKLASQYGYDAETVEDMIQEQGGDVKAVANQIKKGAFRQNLDTLGMESSKSEGGVMGSTLSKETQAAMAQSFQANMRAANKMEEIFEKFDFTSIKDTEKKVDEIVQSMGVSVGDGLGKYANDKGELKVHVMNPGDIKGSASGGSYTGVKVPNEAAPKGDPE